MLDHLSIQCVDPEVSGRFYDTVLATIGGKRVMEFGPVVGYGVDFPDFWIGPVTTGDDSREVHIAFTAPDRAAVTAFRDAAVAAGRGGAARTARLPRVPPDVLRCVRARSRRQQRRGRLSRAGVSRAAGRAARRATKRRLTRTGLLLVQGQAEIPSVADLLAGVPVTTRGYSWDYVPAWNLTDEYESTDDVAVVKLFRGRRTLVRPSALARGRRACDRGS